MTFKVITLCGSTKFKNEFVNVSQKLTLQGSIVLMPHIFNHGDSLNLSMDQLAMLVELHKEVVSMADEIFVIDVGGYVGDSTNNEIKYAINLGKIVRYYSKEFENQ